MWLLIFLTSLTAFKNEKSFREFVKTPNEATENTMWLQNILKRYEKDQTQEADEYEKFMQNWKTKFYSQKGKI